MSRRTIQTINPTTGQVVNSYASHSPEQLLEILKQTSGAQRTWREVPMLARLKVLSDLGEILRREKKTLAALMTSEMGKSPAEGEAEIEKCASAAQFYFEQGAKFLAPLEVKTEATRSFVAFESLGTVLAVMPWNFPFWQVFRCAIPAILAGNTVVLKHASNVSGCALAAERLWAEAAAGHGSLFRTLILPGEEVLALIDRPEISAVSFTGSTVVGKKIAAAAGGSLKKCVLELGGSDAYVVLADADLDWAAETCAKSRLINAGQSCISAKRFIVEAAVLPVFTEKFIARLKAMEIAPMARKDLRQELHDQVKKSVTAGAKLLLGGEIPPGAGWHYPATALAGVRPGMPAFDEELFGPVAAVIEARDEKEAISLANLSPFGLGSAVFTKSRERGERLAWRKLEAGSCFVNDLVRSDPRLPFGGIKESGFGRELADFGIREFTNIKTVYVR